MSVELLKKSLNLRFEFYLFFNLTYWIEYEGLIGASEWMNEWEYRKKEEG